VTAARELTARPGQTHRGYPVQRALRTLAIVFSVALYMLVAPFGYVGFALLCWWWRGDPHRRAFELQRLMGVGYRILHDWLRTFRIADFDHRGALPDLPTGPCILVANHPTQIDVTAIGASLGGACTIVKRAVYRRKLVRPLLVGAGLLEGPAPIRSRSARSSTTGCGASNRACASSCSRRARVRPRATCARSAAWRSRSPAAPARRS
jgi:hypothetical protein